MDPNGPVSPAVIAAMKQRIIEVRLRVFSTRGGRVAHRATRAFAVGGTSSFATAARETRPEDKRRLCTC